MVSFLQTFSIGLWAFGAVLQQLAGLGVDADFVCHAGKKRLALAAFTNVFAWMGFSAL